MAVWVGTLSTNFANNTVVSTGITLPPNHYPIQITYCSADCTFRGTGASAVMRLYFCNSDGSGEVQILQFTSNNGYTYHFMGPQATSSGDIHQKSLSGIAGCQNFKGKAIYLKVKIHSGSGTFAGGSGATIKIKTSGDFTGVTKGNLIKATDRSQTGVSTTAGASTISDSHFSGGTLAEASTFNSKVLGINAEK